MAAEGECKWRGEGAAVLALLGMTEKGKMPG
jgi:hypothetical protein